MSGIVDVNKLSKLAEKEDDDDDSEGSVFGVLGASYPYSMFKSLYLYCGLDEGVDLTGVVIEDDAESELAAVLDRARKLRRVEVKKEPEDADAALKVFRLELF